MTTPAASRQPLRIRVELQLKDTLPAPAYRMLVGGSYRVLGVVRLQVGRGCLLPDFVIIGAARAGTTSLFGWLSRHPFVVPSSVKQVHYFDYRYWRGRDWYRRHFPTSTERAAFEGEHGRPFLTGEASPSYMSHDWAPKRLARVLPDAKLLVILRNPVDRAYSQFQLRRRTDEEPMASFAQAVALEEQRLAPELARTRADRHYHSQAVADWSYLMRGRYADQLERWFGWLPRQQFHILTLDDLSSDPQGTMDGVHEFLGLPAYRYDAFERLNWVRGSMVRRTDTYDPMSEDVRAQLIEYFRPHNERLYRLLGRDFGWESGY